MEDAVGHPTNVWDDAAMLRGSSDLPLIDALHIATAAHAHCDVIVSNDQRMRPALGIEVFPLAPVG